jgi:hypothetical protein
LYGSQILKSDFLIVLINSILLRKTSLSMKLRIILWYLDCKVDYQVAAEIQNNLIILDEGIVQRFVSAFVSELDFIKKPNLRVIKRIMELNDKIVIFDVNPELCVERVADRADINRFVGKSTKQKEMIISNFKLSMSALPRSGNKVVFFDNNKSCNHPERSLNFQEFVKIFQ